MGVSSAGMCLTMLEMICYIIFFHHVACHNNNIAANVLQPSVIKERNNTTAISVLGLFLVWLVKLCYISSVGLFTTFYEMEWFREYSSLIKDFDFVWIPWIEILTSAPIRGRNRKVE